MITIIDYNAGNLGSVDKAFKYVGEEVKIAQSAQDILAAEALVLPGVGAFGDAVNKLKECNMHWAIKDYIAKGRPFLGVCLGLQMLFEHSEETPDVKGLGIFEGEIKLFPGDMGLKIPQMGWNGIKTNPRSRLFKGIVLGEHVYFVHSYYLTAADDSIVAAKCDYGIEFHAAIENNNVFATQFHPEKSGMTGLKILKNFISVYKE